MKKKGLVTLLVAGVMAASAAMPAFALDLQQYYGQDSTEIRTGHDADLGEYHVAAGHKNKYPGWAWIDGYCYYFTNKNMRDKITNGTTPDGYTVDDQGRWTVDGVVQYNGYGSLQVGTDALYAGKDDDARWLAMRGYLERTMAEKWYSSDDAVSFVSTNGGFSFNWPHTMAMLIHNTENGDYLSITVGNGWNDSPERYRNSRGESIELLIKAMCGDHAGQELFDAMRKAAEPAEGGARNQVVYDENRKPIKDEEKSKDGFTYVKMEHYPTSGDGINFNYIDMAKWGSGQMKTDYGKSIFLKAGPNIYDDLASHTPTEWIIEIK